MCCDLACGEPPHCGTYNLLCTSRSSPWRPPWQRKHARWCALRFPAYSTDPSAGSPAAARCLLTHAAAALESDEDEAAARPGMSAAALAHSARLPRLSLDPRPAAKAEAAALHSFHKPTAGYLNQAHAVAQLSCRMVCGTLAHASGAHCWLRWRC